MHGLMRPQNALNIIRPDKALQGPYVSRWRHLIRTDHVTTMTIIEWGNRDRAAWSGAKVAAAHILYVQQASGNQSQIRCLTYEARY